MKRWLLMLVGVTLFLALAGVASANQVVNGTFESIIYGWDGKPIIAPSYDGWTVIPSTQGSNYGFWDVHGYGGPTQYGIYFAGPGPIDDAIGQVIQTVPGTWYNFSFCLARLNTSNRYPDEFSDFKVYWNSTAVMDIYSTAAFTWTYYNYPVLATGTTAAINFAGAALNSGAGYEFTDINVSRSAVPLPGTAALLGSGLLSLLGWRRLRKSPRI
jgi:hypothetical protein